MKSSLWNAIFTDSHFWLPVAVLAIGVVLLMVMK